VTPGDWDRYDEQVRERCAALGVEGTRRALTEGKFGERKARIARAWLQQHDGQSEQDERELDRDIARSAARSARTANRVALGALVVAVAALASEAGAVSFLVKLIQQQLY
jgi:hypothetical protein